jgi:ligand-binding sensor domain-containing protein
LPEIVLQEQFTFTGDVRDILLVGGQVWAATGGGLAIHRRRDGAYEKTLTSADGLPGNSLRSLARLDEGHVLVGSDFAAAIVEVKDGEPSIVTKLGCENGCTRFDPVYAVACDSTGVWLLRHQSGLEHWTRDKDGVWARASKQADAGMWRALAFSAGPVLGGLDGRLAFKDSAGKPAASFAMGAPILALRSREDFVVVATGERLQQARADGVSALVSQQTSLSPAATALSQPTSGGTILVGTARGELFGLHKTVVTSVASGLPGRVTAIATDGDRVWLGLGRAGLHVWTKGAPARSLRPLNEICDNHLIAIVSFAGRTVVGSFDHGACYRDGKGWHLLGGLPSQMVHGLGSDGQDLYVATSNGLLRYDQSFRLRPFSRRDPAVLRWVAQSAVTAIGSVDGTALAMTSAYGLVQVRRSGSRLSAQFTSHRGGVPLKRVAVASTEGEIWMASETEGVKSLAAAGAPARHLQDPDDLPENWVTAVAAVGRNDLWVGTCQHGVAHIHGDHRRFFSRQNLLLDDMVVALAADSRGAFVGTLGGLAFVRSDGEQGRSFGWDAGIPDPRSSALLLTDNQLWLGTEAGLARYQVR